MGRHEAGDPLLHLLEPAHRLGHTQDHAGMPHRVDGHGGGGHDEAPLGADGQRDADGVPAAQHHGGAGLRNAGDELSQGQPRFHIAAHSVQEHQQPFHRRVLLHRHQLRDDMLILGGLLALRRFHVALDLADDGQAVDGVGPFGAVHAAHIFDLLFFQPPFFDGGVFFVCHMLLRISFFQCPPPAGWLCGS